MIRGLDGRQIVITKWYANQNPLRHTDGTECVTYVLIHFPSNTICRRRSGGLVLHSRSLLPIQHSRQTDARARKLFARSLPARRPTGAPAIQLSRLPAARDEVGLPILHNVAKYV